MPGPPDHTCACRWIGPLPETDQGWKGGPGTTGACSGTSQMASAGSWVLGLLWSWPWACREPSSALSLQPACDDRGPRAWQKGGLLNAGHWQDRQEKLIFWGRTLGWAPWAVSTEALGLS